MPDSMLLAAATAALSTRAGLEIIDAKETTVGNGGVQWRIMGRVRPNQMGQWRVFLKEILTAQLTSGWKFDISKSYFLRGEEIVYAWRLILQNPDPTVLVAINNTPKAKIEIEEFPLVGVSGNRHGNKVRGVLEGGPPGRRVR